MIKNIYLFLVGIILLAGCANSNDDLVPVPEDDVDVLILTDEIETYNENSIHDNLVLIMENGDSFAYLVNKEGERLISWDFDRNLGNDLELLPDGNLLGIFKSDNPHIEFGGWGGIVRLIQPDGTIVWEFEMNTENAIIHHDVELLPNGNILLLIWEKTDKATAQSAGADTIVDLITEKLIEIDPDTDQIVWEWRSWDHIIQDIDLNLPNYGVLADNPQRININHNPDNDKSDIMHANGIDYDRSKDIIYLSVNFYSEIWVIDHSTTTLEAAGTTGGTYGKGGDLIYRFGNPLAYDNAMGQVRFDRNHFPNILQQGEVGAGNLLIFVNGISTGQSTVYELELPQLFSLMPNTDNEPTIAWSFTDPEMFSDKISGAVRLSNGNTLICEGDYGYWEVTPTGEIAWKYNGMGERFWRGYAYDLDDPALAFLNISF